MKNEDYKTFFDTLVNAIAGKVMESSMVANEVARLVGHRQDVVDKIIDEIDPAKVGEHIARNMNHIMHTSRRNNVTTADAVSAYNKIMKDSQARATEIITDQMVKDAMEIR